MGLKEYFFDSYALFELVYANPHYENYMKDISVMTTKLNLMELYYGLLRKHGKQLATICYDRFLPDVVDIDNDIIKEAMEFRLLQRKMKLSYVDSIGYIIAKRHGILFLTGDKAFEHLPNVEFVK